MTTLTELHERAKLHTVKLGAGSGVLINGNTDEFSYILTAKHVVMPCQQSGTTDCSLCSKKGECAELECSEVVNEPYDRDPFTATAMFRSEKWDALILKVPYQANLSLLISSDDVQPGESVTLFGYPGEACKASEDIRLQLKSFDLVKINEVKSAKKLDFRNKSYADKDGVVGFSGGGLFTFEPEMDSILLIGIENRMDNEESAANHICGVMLSAYADIIKENQLAKLKPVHLSNFRHSKDHIFGPYELSDEYSLDGVKTVISGLLEERVFPSTLSPDKILGHFSDKLVAYRQEHRELEEQRLWIWFLEFLAIQLITKPPNSFSEGWEESYLEEIFTSYRFIYSNRHIGYKSIYRELLLPTPGLDRLCKAAKIILLTAGKEPPSPLLDKKEFNKKISNISQASRGNVATVRRNEEIKNDVIHWPKLNNHCLEESEDDFIGLNDEQKIVALLGKKYTPYLRAVGGKWWSLRRKK